MKKIIISQVAIATMLIASYYIYINYINVTEPIESKGYAWYADIENKYENNKIPDNFYSVVDNDFKQSENNEYLVFRFSEIYCGSCVTREIRLLREAAKTIGWDNIIFLATNSDENYLKRYKRVSRIETEIYKVPVVYFEIDKESLSTPYMFVLGPDSTFKELFVSMKENEVRTKQYLDKITKKYF